MYGVVDENGRALLSLTLHSPPTGTNASYSAWIDTGFTGDIVLPLAEILSLGLAAGYSIRAALADGSEIQVKTYAAQLDWFGERRTVEVIANDGRSPLLGVGLLRDRDLHISYRNQTLAID